MKIEALIQTQAFSDEAHKAILNVMATSSWVHSQIAARMVDFNVTPAQYNVLRILQGGHPQLMTCSDIGARLLDRTPDVTRLLNRLEESGYIVRTRSATDRRVVEVGISRAGTDLLNEMRPHIEKAQIELTRHLEPEQLTRLNALLELVRTDQVV